MSSHLRLKLGLFGLSLAAMISTASADINLSALWDFITEITDNQGIIIGVIILVVVLGIVRKFGKSLGNMLDIGGK